MIVYLKNLNIRAETIKFFNENKGQKLQDTAFDNDFLDTCQRHKEEKIKKQNKTMYFITIKNCASKDTINRVKMQSTEWENILNFQIIYLIIQIYPKYIQNS